VKLNLGCCDALVDGFLNVDIVSPPDLEPSFRFVRVDLRAPWPWESSSIEVVRAYDFIEHLPDKILTMNEAWRVLQPGGLFDISVPTTEGRGAWQDPTHVSYWNRNSFCYYEASHGHFKRFARYYGIRGGFRVVRESQYRTIDQVERLDILLEALKE
jgi:predicted SAM-dependent methyltransferase